MEESLKAAQMGNVQIVTHADIEGLEVSRMDLYKFWLENPYENFDGEELQTKI